MIGFTRLLENNKYADTLVTSRGMWPPPIIIKLHKALGIHVIKKKTNRCQRTLQNMDVSTMEFRCADAILYDIGVDIICAFLSPFGKFSNRCKILQTLSRRRTLKAL